jgi:multimeric flavodoxin WrbA
MAKVLVIYHTQTGNTEEMARAVGEGAASVVGAEVTLKKAADAVADDLLSHDAIGFGSPMYIGYMAGAIKDFFDRSMMKVAGKVAGKPCVAFGSTGSGGKQAIEGVEGICSAMGLKKAAEGVVATGKPSSEVLERCRELGKKLATT